MQDRFQTSIGLPHVSAPGLKSFQKARHRWHAGRTGALQHAGARIIREQKSIDSVTVT